MLKISLLFAARPPADLGNWFHRLQTRRDTAARGHCRKRRKYSAAFLFASLFCRELFCPREAVSLLIRGVMLLQNCHGQIYLASAQSAMSVPYHQLMRERANTGVDALSLIERACALCRSSATSPRAVQMLEAVNELFWHHVNRRNPHLAEAIAHAAQHSLGPLLLTPKQARQLRDLCTRTDASWSFVREALSEQRPSLAEPMLMPLDLRTLHSVRDRLEPVLQHVMWPVAMRLHPSTRLGRELLQQCASQTLASLDSASLDGDPFTSLRARMNAGEIVDATLLGRVARLVREVSWRTCDQLLEHQGMAHASAAELAATRRRDRSTEANPALLGTLRDRSATSA